MRHPGSYYVPGDLVGIGDGWGLELLAQVPDEGVPEDVATRSVAGPAVFIVIHERGPERPWLVNRWVLVVASTGQLGWFSVDASQFAWLGTPLWSAQ